MKKIFARRFEASPLAVLDEVQKTRTPIQVTRNGKALAEIVPPAAIVVDPKTKPNLKRRELGFLKGEIEIIGDIVGPVYEDLEWGDLKY